MTKEEEKLRKFLASDDLELVRMGIALAKGMKVKVTVGDLEHFFLPEYWDGFLEELESEYGLSDALLAEIEEALEIGLMLADEAGILGEMGSSRAIEPFVLMLKADEATVREVAVVALVKMQAVDVFSELLTLKIRQCIDSDVSYRHNRLWKFPCIDIVDAIIQIGDKVAIAPLLGMLNKGCWWTPELALRTLTGLEWTPETEEERIAVVIARKDWEGCRQMGEVAVARAIEYLFQSLYPASSTHGDIEWQIVETIESFGMVEEFKKNPDFQGVIWPSQCRKCGAYETNTHFSLWARAERTTVWQEPLPSEVLCSSCEPKISENPYFNRRKKSIFRRFINWWR